MLLALIVSYDHRQAGDQTVAAWQEVSRRGRWTFDEAREAVLDHFATSTEYLKPAHITQWIKAKRQQPPPSRTLEAPAKPPANPEHIREVISALSARLGWPQRGETGSLPSVTCPHCGAAPGRPCARQIGRGHRRGQWVPIGTIHPSRKELAEENPC